jgi:hypothetical protein
MGFHASSLDKGENSNVKVLWHCPCCLRALAEPTGDLAVYSAAMAPRERIVFDVLARGKGRAVHITTLMDAMYADDPTGGPDWDLAYGSLRRVIFRIRKRLDGSGVSIEGVRSLRGYRIKIAT